MRDFLSIRTFTSRRRGLRPGMRRIIERLHKKNLFFQEDHFTPSPSMSVEHPSYAIYGELPLLANEQIPQIVVDVGCGTGESLFTLASLLPTTECYGVEVDRVNVAKILRVVEKREYENVKVFVSDIFDVSWFSSHSIEALHLFFPDPWPKKRHHKRRIIHPQRMFSLLQSLKPGGYLAVCTDWEEYAWWIREVLENTPGLTNRYEGFAPRPSWRPITYYEHRAQIEGRMVRDMLFDYATDTIVLATT